MLLDRTVVAIPEITVTGAQILVTVGTAMTLSALIMFAKGSGPDLVIISMRIKCGAK